MMKSKLYPSQINSKTISARIPVEDYVRFLNESIANGISLNDFFLRKIYNNDIKPNQKSVGENDIVGKVHDFNETQLEMLNWLLKDLNMKSFNRHEVNPEYFEDKPGERYPYHNVRDILSVQLSNEIYCYDLNNLLQNAQTITSGFNRLDEKNDKLIEENELLKEELKRRSVPDLLDVKNQLTVLIQDTFDLEGQKAFRRDLFKLLKELE